jgi:predicted RNA binding protein YcfA (HicA-like mRNA interferase family)
MSRLPALTAREVIRALEKAGFRLVRITGSHHHLAHGDRPRLVTVPVHGGDVAAGTLRAIIRQSGMTRDEFLRLL